MKNLRQTKKDITGYYGDGRGNIYIFSTRGTRVLANSKKTKAQ